MKRTACTALSLWLILLLTGCTAVPSETRVMRKSFFAMNTYNTLTVYDSVPDEVLDDAVESISTLEKLWSVTDTGSEVYAINHANGQPVHISETTAALLRFALNIADQTDGAFDPTIYPVLKAWGFTTGSYRIPQETELETLLQNVGSAHVSLSGNEVCLTPGTEIDLGAVAKGFACDLLAEQLQNHSVHSAIISLGGGIRLIGSKPDGNPFRVAVRHPDNEHSLGVLSLKDTCIMTSGAYERYFTGPDGKRYGHILNPATGCPVDNDVLSVTVIAQDGKRCDALSTALFVMGTDQAEAFWRSCGCDFDMLILTEDGTLILTEGMESAFEPDEQWAALSLWVLRS